MRINLPRNTPANIIQRIRAVDAMSLSELEAAMLAAPYGDDFDVLVAAWTARLLARVVTGDDGLDHYL